MADSVLHGKAKGFAKQIVILCRETQRESFTEHFKKERENMNELDALKYAKMFIDKMAHGINPLTNQSVPQTDLIANQRISKCLSYVSDILQEKINALLNMQVKEGCVVSLLDCESGKSMQLKILPSYYRTRYVSMGYRTKNYVKLTKTSDADGFNSISDDSPLGKAILGKRAEDEVCVKINGKPFRYRITYVSDSNDQETSS